MGLNLTTADLLPLRTHGDHLVLRHGPIARLQGVAIVAKRVEWAFGKWYSRKPLLQSGDINYETWFQTTTRG